MGTVNLCDQFQWDGIPTRLAVTTISFKALSKRLNRQEWKNGMRH